MARIRLVRQQTRAKATTSVDEGRQQDAGDEACPTENLDDLHRRKLAFFRGLIAAIGGSILFWIVVYLCVSLAGR